MGRKEQRKELFRKTKNHNRDLCPCRFCFELKHGFKRKEWIGSSFDTSDEPPDPWEHKDNFDETGE